MRLERRLWPSLKYISLLLLICLTIWQISIRPSIELTQYPSTAYSLYGSNSTGYTYPLSTLPSTDYRRLIDHNFTFSTLNFLCNNDSSGPLLLILVHSAPNNFAKRQAIRETWGSFNNNLKVVFALGAVQNSKLQKRLDEENEMNGDFIQGTFEDSYRNLTYKHVMVLKYVTYHCPQAKYILKTDDDVFVNIPTMLNFLTNDLSQYGASNVLFCTPRRNVRVLRTYRSKWRVSFSEYPERTYPTYCPGWVLLYSPDVVFNLYKEAQKAPYFWIDDTHITGTLAKKIHASHTNIESLVISKTALKYIGDHSYNIKKPFLFGSPNLKEEEIRSLWRYVKNHPPPKTVLKDLQLD